MRCRVGNNFPQFVWRGAHWAVDVRLARNNMVVGVDVTRLDISPNPAPMAAELNLEVRARPHRSSASSAPGPAFRNPLTSISVPLSIVGGLQTQRARRGGVLEGQIYGRYDGNEVRCRGTSV